MALGRKFERCERCKKYAWFPGHLCLPYDYRIEGEHDEDSWDIVYAADMEDAATEAAELFDQECGDYPILHKNDSVTVIIKNGDEEKRFKVHGETQPHYYAEEIK